MKKHLITLVLLYVFFTVTTMVLLWSMYRPTLGLAGALGAVRAACER